MLVLRYCQGSSCKWRRTGTLTLFLPLFSRPFPLSLLSLPLLFLTAMTPLIQIGGLGQVCKTKLNLLHFSLLTSGGMIFVWISWPNFVGGGWFPWPILTMCCMQYPRWPSYKSISGKLKPHIKVHEHHRWQADVQTAGIGMTIAEHDV